MIERRPTERLVTADDLPDRDMWFDPEELHPYMDAQDAAVEQLQRERDNLREAIREHRRNMWGGGKVKHEEDTILYSVLDGGMNDDVPRVFAEVAAERARQDAKWGEQNHHPFAYLAILMEEVGEASQAALEAEFGGPHTLGDYRSELVQVAAVAVAMVESFDRAHIDGGQDA